MKNKDKLILFGLIILALGFVIQQLSSVLMPFVISFVIAYFLHPLVAYFSSKKISPTVSVLIIMFVFFAIFSAILALILPILYRQSSEMFSELPQYIKIFRNEIYPKYVTILNDMGISINGSFDDILNSDEFLNFVKEFMLGVFTSTTAAINVFSLIFIMPILIFYLLKDWNLIVKNFNGYLPRNSAAKVSKILKDIDVALSGYVRGQIIVCLIMAVIYSILFSVTGLNFGFLIGLFTGIFTFIPYIGASIGLVAAIVIACFQWQFNLFEVSQVALAFFIGQIIESNFLTPKLIGAKVGLHPVWVIFGIFLFGTLFGFAGILLAMPLTAICGVLIKDLMMEYKKRFV